MNRTGLEDEHDDTVVSIRLRPVGPADARAGGPYLTVRSCDEVNAACNRFFKKRNMKVGKDYCKELNNK